ncbi:MULTISPECIES: CsbD family protein [unclassified Myxococcus]|uniref:CsbD family protein n=1 Tax=unclassified Myxococcus TaxID=2648731 RepID=UPI00157ACA8D|nr:MULTISPECIES: CsbD family protein [unclassified Myxococcus]NTX34720.1 CsbD family protein [Myxococcus sp. CA033]NTX50349.1 CsbD family protein [Myxococcus sp. CA039A]
MARLYGFEQPLREVGDRARWPPDSCPSPLRRHVWRGSQRCDRSLEAEGKVDTAKGHAKEKVEDAKRAVRDAVDDDKPRRDEP